MKQSNYVLRSFLNALGTGVYVTLVALLMFNGEKIFGNESKNFLIPVFMLLLFILSASITGLLVLGKPVLLYLEGLKKEAVILLLSTLSWLLIFLIMVFLVLFLR